MRSKTCWLATAAVVATAGSALAQTTTLYRFQKEDVSTLSVNNDPNPSNFWIGNNPSAVAYGKGNLFVAGFANGTPPTTITWTVSAVKINNIFGTRSFNLIPSSRVVASTAGRGFTGMDYDGTFGLVAAVDYGGGSDKHYMRFGVDAAGDGTDLGSTPFISSRLGTAGPAWDFGPTGLGFGSPARPAIAGVSFGEGGPRGIDPNTMLLSPLIYSVGSPAPTSPLIVQDGGATQWRDLAIDPRNGTAVGRMNNNVMGVTRNPDGNGTPILLQGSPRLNSANSTTAVGGQQISLMWGYSGAGTGGDVFIWNDRRTGGGGQSFNTVVRMNRVSDGADVAVDWRNAAGSPLVFPTDIATGVGYYDFHWDNQLQVLFVSDFANRFVEIFSVQQPGACCLPSAGGCVVLPANVCTVVRGGTAGTPGSVCSPDPCSAPLTGACCLGVGCTVTTSAACTGSVGTSARQYRGDGTVCNAPGTPPFTNNLTPCCRADFNKNGTREPNDIFNFLTNYFSTDAAAKATTDTTGDGVQAPADIFAFLTIYFAGGCP
jgi:hypothetical protein